MIRLCLLVLGSMAGVSAQRAKDGCFDRYAPSCSQSGEAPEGVDPFDICTRINEEVFPNDVVFESPALHAEYLNSIDADDNFCSEIAAVYHLCLFCAEEEVKLECSVSSFVSRCSNDLPSREEVLEDNENYPLFQSETDIDGVCERLEEVYGRDSTFNTGYISTPPTIKLCEQQAQVKHLCGYCEGGCFDGSTGRAPTCEPYEGPLDPDLDAYFMCEALYGFWCKASSP